MHHGLQRAEVLGEVFSRGFAHEADAQSEQHAPERDFGRAADRPDDVVGRLLAQPRQRRELLGTQVVQVGDVVQQGVVVQQFDGLLAQALDVHGLAADEVEDASDDLGAAAALIGAVVFRLAFVAHQRRAALGAAVDVAERPAVGRTLRKLHARDLGDDLAALLHVDHVARADVQQGHLLGVVQRRAAHGGSGQQHRIEVRHGGDGARAAYLEGDAFEACQGLLGLELVGHGPFRCLGREAQLPPHGEVVHLDDHAVGGEGQLPPRLVPMGDEGVDLGDAAADARLAGDLEAPFAGLFEALPMGREGQVVARELVERAVQPAARHDGRLLLLERSGGGVARVGEELFAVGLALGVEAVERGVGHQHFAADLEQFGPPFAAQPQRHGAHRADVGRHVVALDAVAAREGLHEPPVFVGERNGRAVELQLAYVVRRACLAFDASEELVQLVERVGVAQREHGVAVAHGAELGPEVAAHAQRGRRGVGVFGMFAFELLEFAHHRVEVEIGDFGRVFDIVFMVVVVELPAQLLDPLAYHRNHCIGTVAFPDVPSAPFPGGPGLPKRPPVRARRCDRANITCVKVRNLSVRWGENKKNAIKKLRMRCDMQILLIIAENFEALSVWLNRIRRRNIS